MSTTLYSLLMNILPMVVVIAGAAGAFVLVQRGRRTNPRGYLFGMIGAGLFACYGLSHLVYVVLNATEAFAHAPDTVVQIFYLGLTLVLALVTAAAILLLAFAAFGPARTQQPPYDPSQQYGGNQQFSGSQPYGGNQPYSGNQQYGGSQPTTGQPYGANQSYGANQPYDQGQHYGPGPQQNPAPQQGAPPPADTSMPGQPANPWQQSGTSQGPPIPPPPA